MFQWTKTDLYLGWPEGDESFFLDSFLFCRYIPNYVRLFQKVNLSFTPVLTNSLPDGIRIVRDPQVGQVFANLFCHFFRCEAHGCDVVSTQGKLAFRGLHELNGGPMRVRYVHHGKPSVGAQVTFMVAGAEGILKYLDSIIWGKDYIYN